LDAADTDYEQAADHTQPRFAGSARGCCNFTSIGGNYRRSMRGHIRCTTRVTAAALLVEYLQHTVRSAFGSRSFSNSSDNTTIFALL
jgi:hypothetical protein